MLRSLVLKRFVKVLLQLWYHLWVEFGILPMKQSQRDSQGLVTALKKDRLIYFY